MTSDTSSRSSKLSFLHPFCLSCRLDVRSRPLYRHQISKFGSSLNEDRPTVGIQLTSCMVYASLSLECGTIALELTVEKDLPLG